MMAALATLGVAAAWTAGATLMFRHGAVFPLVEPITAALLTLGGTVGYRFVVADRGKRLLRQSFSLYLPPAVIEKMMASNKPPALGGEMRNVTVYFSDIADFSTYSEKIAPAELVAAMNEYLSAMTDIIEAHGGFVDKYIGDAIVAVFGAPLDEPDHAKNAVQAALQCAARLSELDRVKAAFGGDVRQRIGLNTGEALVGNIGSRRRFNYTVMGDMVNLASRLEGANKFFGTTIMASETTRQAAGDAFAWRELDAIRVKGRAQAVKIYEPLGLAGEISPDLQSRTKAYADGLARYRARDFAAAAEQFAKYPDDPPAARFAERARELSGASAGAGLGAGQCTGGEVAARPLPLRGRMGKANPRKSTLRVPFSVHDSHGQARSWLSPSNAIPSPQRLRPPRRRAALPRARWPRGPAPRISPG